MYRWLVLLPVLFSSSAFSAGPRISSRELENRIVFSYASSDGDFKLDCKHWIGNEGAGDFTVICGKGTPSVKEYSVHLLI